MDRSQPDPTTGTFLGILRERALALSGYRENL